MYPDEHCIKAPELLHESGVGEEMIHAICSPSRELENRAYA